MSQATKKRLLFGRIKSLFKKCKHRIGRLKQTPAIAMTARVYLF
jgi:hypothetical protein